MIELGRYRERRDLLAKLEKLEANPICNCRRCKEIFALIDEIKMSDSTTKL
jgi:hypothetical protein